jgi:hypothetical protein
VKTWYFGFLSLAYPTQHDDNQFHPFFANDIISFLGLRIFHGMCVCITFSFISCWAPRLIPRLDYSKQNSNKHVYAYLSSMFIYTPSDICPRVV